MKGILDLAKVSPVLLWGAPGIGKTASVLAEAKARGLPIEVVIASIREPTDFSGLPVLRDHGVEFAAPSWARRLVEEGRGVLFFDEITTAPPAVQAALLRVILDRVVGDLRLPDSVLIVAAANPPEWAAGGWELTPPLANRFLHIQFKVDPIQWSEEFPQYWGNPPKVDGLEESVWSRARALIATFIRRRPELLLSLPKSVEARGRAWPSPRTWDFASRVLALYNLDIEASAEAILGAVGEAGLEFISFVKNLDLPDPEDILKNPSSFKVPERLDLTYAILSSLVSAVTANLTKDRWLAAWDVLKSAADQGALDVAAVAARNLARLREKNPRLPLPVDQVRVFLPLLSQGGEDVSA